MSRSRSNPPPASDRSTGPQVALDALLESDAGNPLRRALWLDALDLQLRPYLPPGIAAHARLANLDRGKLIYLVDAPVWHARLRLASTELLDTARSLGLDAHELVVKITSSPLFGPSPARPTAGPVVPLSATAQEAVRTALSGRGDTPDDKSP